MQVHCQLCASIPIGPSEWHRLTVSGGSGLKIIFVFVLLFFSFECYRFLELKIEQEEHSCGMASVAGIEDKQCTRYAPMSSHSQPAHITQTHNVFCYSVDQQTSEYPSISCSMKFIIKNHEFPNVLANVDRSGERDASSINESVVFLTALGKQERN